MSIKVFQTNKAGKIEFTRCELEKLLNEIYNEGYYDGENHAKITSWTWASPSLINPITYCNSVADTATATLAGSIADGTDKTDARKASITAINNDEAKKISVQTHGELKNGKADVSTKITTSDSPEKVYELKGMTYNMDDLAKTIDAILNGVDLLAAKSAPADNHFNNLAKELRSL